MKAIKYVFEKLLNKLYLSEPAGKKYGIRSFPGLTIIIISVPLLVMNYSCSSTQESSPSEIRDRISEYRRQIGEINREINILENELSEMGEPVDNRQGIRVTTDKVTRGPFDHYFRINGSVEAVQQAIISPETNGQVKNILVTEGQRIVRGQELGRLNTSVIENNIEELKTNINLAKTVFERQKGLWEQQIGSEIQYLEAKNSYESLLSRLKSLESQLDMAVMRAPFSGVVDKIHLKEGELAMPGLPVMQIINLDRLYVNADVSETYLPKIDPGDNVILRFPAYPDYEANVSIYRMSHVINPENRTFRIHLRIDNPQERFKPNMVASLNIRSFSADDVIVVPSILIKQDIQGFYVYVARKNGNGSWQSHKQYVERGPEGEGQTMIHSGLEEGDMMIIQGHNQLAQGTSITPVQSL